MASEREPPPSSHTLSISPSNSHTNGAHSSQLCYVCTSGDNCLVCQATGCCNCCKDNNCCLPRRYPYELKQAQGHRVSLKASSVHYDRDAMRALVLKHWITVDKYGRATSHVGERFAPIGGKSVHIPLVDAEFVLVPMSELPTPIHVYCGLQCEQKCCGCKKIATPQGYVFMLRAACAGSVGGGLRARACVCVCGVCNVFMLVSMSMSMSMPSRLYSSTVFAAQLN